MKCSKTTTSDNFRHRVVAEYRVLFLARAKPFTLVSEWFPRIYTSRPESQTNVIISSSGKKLRFHFLAYGEIILRLACPGVQSSTPNDARSFRGSERGRGGGGKTDTQTGRQKGERRRMAMELAQPDAGIVQVVSRRLRHSGG